MTQIVKLNVGGFYYQTTLATLMSDPESMLARMIDQPNEKERINNGEELFIDRNGTIFTYILDYLRCNDHVALPSNISKLNVLLQEADFYQLHGLIDLIKRGDNFKMGDLVGITSSGGGFLAAVVGKTTMDLKASCYCWVCQNPIQVEFPEYFTSRCCMDHEKIMGKILDLQGDCAEIRVPYSSLKASFGDNGWLIDTFIKLHMPLKFLKKN